MRIDDKRFDLYLASMARSLGSESVGRLTVVPDVDGGLIFSMQDRRRKRYVVWLKHEEINRFERRLFFDSQDAPPSLVKELETRLSKFVARHRHSLMEFQGLDIDEIVLGKGVELQHVWRRYLAEGKTRWGESVLETLEPRSGALYLLFSDKRGSVRLRLTDREDPRLALSRKVLFINNIALSIVEDDRPKSNHPLAEVERFVAYLVSHTTGRCTRIKAKTFPTPSVLLYGKDVEVNPFVPEGRQGASGMVGCLAGNKTGPVRVLCLGDASCRQTFPPLSRLKFFDTWSYFPVDTAPLPGRWAAVDFAEKDVINGAESKFREAAMAVKRDDRDARVAVVQTCISRQVGDDIRGVLGGVIKARNYAVLDPDFQSKEISVDSVLWSWLCETFRSSRRPKKDRRAINLVGFGGRRFRGARELIRLLDGFGVSVNASLFPSFDEAEMRRFDAASLTVASSCRIVRNAFSATAKRDRRNRWLFTNPPFGVGATKSWIWEILRNLKARQPLARDLGRLGRLYRRYEAQVNDLKPQLENRSMAIVASSRFSSFVFQPSEAFGIPIVDFLSELGMKVEVFVFKDAPLPKDLVEKLEGHGRVKLSVYESRERLVEGLKASGSGLLLTSIRKNGFAFSVGKVPCTVHVFEMGFEGAVRTARKLAAYSRFGFAEKFREYLRT